jgi:hypothetical protein
MVDMPSKSTLDPLNPTSNVQPKLGEALGLSPLLLIKSGCTLNESHKGFLGHGQPLRRVEVIAEKVKASVYPAY